MKLSAEIGALGDVLSDRQTLEVLGAAGKRAALEEIEADLGADRTFSGWRRPVPIKARYDVTGRATVEISMFPEGLVRLLDEGRRRTRKIIPKATRRRRKGRRPAVITTRGLRYSATSRPSRGHHTLTRIERRLDTDVLDEFDAHLYRRLVS